jgi:ectoine hydroxylase-related dioxygenase (phytanoyl-CoA dioxygenase family)
MSLSDLEREELDHNGYVVLPGFMGPALVTSIRSRIDELFAQEGDRAGSEFKQEAGSRRLANLVDKGSVFQEVIMEPVILEYVDHVLGHEYKLSSLNARSADPKTSVTQPLHADMAALPDARGFWVCNTVWMLDNFTEENGALRCVPGSHKWGELPCDAMDDPVARHHDEVLVTGKAGTIVVMNAHLWHGGMANKTSRSRLALHAFYVRRDKPQQQYQKQLLRPEVQEAYGEKLRWLLALDDPLNDEISENPEVRSGFLP